MRSHQFHYLHGRSRMQFQQYHHAYGHPYFFYLPNSFTNKKPKRYAIPSQGKPSGLSINNYNYLRARFARQTINSHGEERNRSDNPPPLVEKPEDVPATGREETANERGLREADRRMTTERTVSCLNYSNQKIGHERKSVINETIKKKTTFEVESERLFSQCVDEAGHEMRHKKRQLSVSRPTIIVRGREPPSEKTDPTSSNSASSWAHGKRFELQNIEEGKREEDKERRKRERKSNFQLIQNQEVKRSSKYQHSTAQHSTAQHSTAQHSTAQHSTAQYSTVQYSSQSIN